MSTRMYFLYDGDCCEEHSTLNDALKSASEIVNGGNDLGDLILWEGKKLEMERQNSVRVKVKTPKRTRKAAKKKT